MIKPTLGIAMIMQNEENHIPAALSQFFTVADQIVVVDGGSQDNSVVWAEKMGAEVYHRPFDKDFGAQKNFAIEKLNTEWVYLTDPDERLEPTLVELLPLMINDRDQQVLMDLQVLPTSTEYFDCYGIPRKNFLDGELSSVYPDYQYRLFKNHCRLEGKVHEEITNFNKRTELDYIRNSLDTPSRFNILHYKSTKKQLEQNQLYAEIEQSLKGN